VADQLNVLLSGPERFDPKGPGPGRVQCHLYVLDKSLTKPPVPRGTKCSEGPAVSRRRLHTAWTHVSAQYPDRLPRGASQMHEADLVYEKGAPRLAGARLVLDSRDLPFRCTLETQNFRPPEEKELTFSAYGYHGTEVCGVGLRTRKVTNYSNAPGQYDEPEGTFPGGKPACVGPDGERGTWKNGHHYVDIWGLALGGRVGRPTHFNRYTE
jgi:hypothetical protein